MTQTLSSVKCPRCSAYTINEPTVAERMVRPVGTLNRIKAHVSLTIRDVAVVTCRSCFEDFITRRDLPVWPLASPTAPEGVPEKVKEAYEDARLAHAAGANIGALLAARTALERLMRDKRVSNYKELSDTRVITPALYGGADQLRLWANVAGHDDIDTGTFATQEVGDILDYLGLVLEAVYTHQARVNRFVSRTKELESQG